ncbi:hypothetical protein AVEN_105099-1 [Araneus ventricosus]|uniref:Chitin-binding type-2 domain-containing protein n=1 Tax=Araneus ventricosus TaxID=182803 RepID=A0A4Y2K697_ARAVE|nr:hypothetical protein AVEN_105099-1 [Araneus ventricosus]
MKSYICFNWSFLLVALLVGHALADDSSDSSDSGGASDANEKFLKNMDCIFKSGDQDLCDQFLLCNAQLPVKILKPYYDCVRDLLGNDIGECTDDEQLYYSPETRRQINYCVFSQVDGLNDNELQQLNYVLKQLEASFVQIKGREHVPHRGRSRKHVGACSDLFVHVSLLPTPASRSQSTLVAVRINY